MPQLPQQFELYQGDEVISTGLVESRDGFALNGGSIQLYAGSTHYFRIHPDYWRDRLRRLRACGLVAVTTYVPWNLHEPEDGHFDFGEGKNDMSQFLDLLRFIKIAQEEDLFMILRPGPYICSEWDFGGLPSWLLRIPNVKLRTSRSEYIEKVKRYFGHLLPMLQKEQFTYGGPIIGFQIENEYGADGIPHDSRYLVMLKDLFHQHGIKEYLFTSDNFYDSQMEPLPIHKEGFVPGALMTINFQKSAMHWLNELKKIQPDAPVMVMEYWTGWLDHWLEPTQSDANPPEEYKETLETILQFPAHVNLYMFHGGTNFGFMNGANQSTVEDYTPDVTSYDYYAPLRENGDYTEKYWMTKELLEKYIKIKTRLPAPPKPIPTFALDKIPVIEQINYDTIIHQIPHRIHSETMLSMEELDINHSNGQSYGFLVYRKEEVKLQPNSLLHITGHVHDVAVVLASNQLLSKPLDSVDNLNSFGFWMKKNGSLKLKLRTAGSYTLDIMVENMGRTNYGPLITKQKKGLLEGPVTVDGNELEDWTHIPLEFKSKWLTGLKGWEPFSSPLEAVGPGLFKANFQMKTKGQDTFVDMSDWIKGVVFINGFNLGRYWNLGPQKTLYLPAPFLKVGENEIIIFEIYAPGRFVKLTDRAILG